MNGFAAARGAEGRLQPEGHLEKARLLSHSALDAQHCSACLNVSWLSLLPGFPGIYSPILQAACRSVTDVLSSSVINTGGGKGDLCHFTCSSLGLDFLLDARCTIHYPFVYHNRCEMAELRSQRTPRRNAKRQFTLSSPLNVCWTDTHQLKFGIYPKLIHKPIKTFEPYFENAERCEAINVHLPASERTLKKPKPSSTEPEGTTENHLPSSQQVRNRGMDFREETHVELQLLVQSDSKQDPGQHETGSPRHPKPGRTQVSMESRALPKGNWSFSQAEHRDRSWSRYAGHPHHLPRWGGPRCHGVGVGEQNPNQPNTNPTHVSPARL